MSSELKFQSHENSSYVPGKVKVTDLISRMNDEKRIEKKKKFSFRRCGSISSYSFWNNINNINLFYIF